MRAKKQALIFVALFVLSTTLNLFAQSDNMKVNFKDPPRTYSLLPFWAWNHTLEPEKLKWQIDQMVDKNVFGAFMHARKGINKGRTPYFSKGWWNAIDTAVNYGKEAGFYPWLYDEDKWPSGSAGGRTVAVNPDEYSQKGLLYSKIEIQGRQNIKLPTVDNLVAVIAARTNGKDRLNADSLTDISEYSGKNWSVPEGNWVIMTFWQEREEFDPARQPHGIDYLDKDAVAAFINITYDEYYKRYGEHFGDLVPGIFFDEISAKLPSADFAWTDDFLEKFKQLKRYDLKKYLPLLACDGGDITAKIRCDYFDVFTMLYEDAWFKQIGEWCGEHKLPLTGHTYEDIYSYATQGDYFRTLSHLQIPLTDNEEFRYSFPIYIEWFKPKQLCSIAHLNGRELTAAEALGGSKWSYTLEELRYGLSMLSVYGINFMVLHGFYYTIDTPLTSSDFPPSWFYQNPHWKYFGKVGKFAQRITYMGRQGDHVCDVAVFYPVTSQWASGRSNREDGLGKKYTIDEFDNIREFQYYNIQQALLDNQIDYDIIDPASLLKTDVSDGKIKIAKAKYSVLILPPLSVIRTPVLEKIKSFVEKGGVVIALNTLPTASAEVGGKDPVIIKTIKDIFGFNPRFLRSGYYEIDETRTEEFTTNVLKKNGRAYFTKAVKDAVGLVERHITKDIIIEQGNPQGFVFGHKTKDNRKIYHLMNSQKVPRQWTVSFNCSGTIEKWHPETGRTEKIYGVKDSGGQTEINLSFEPWETYYIVFNTSEKQEHNIALAQTNLEDAQITAIDKNKVTVQGYAAADTAAVFANLTYGVSKNHLSRQQRTDNLIPELELAGKWSFTPAGDVLDYKWQPALQNSQIPLPVMQLCIDRKNTFAVNDLLSPQSGNIYFKQIKVIDTANTLKGCGRYLSGWDGWWITYTDQKPHWGTVGGKEIKYRKTIAVEDAVKDAWLCLTAVKSYRLFINGKAVGEDNNSKNAETYDIKSYLKKGENLLEVIVKDAGALLLQGRITLKDGRNIEIVSDNSWKACNENALWIKACEYVNPPVGPWGNIENPKQPIDFPVTVWYRQKLPAGTVGMLAPQIKGDFEIFVNGQKVNTAKKRITFEKLLNGNDNVLLIKVNVKEYSDGLIEPVMVYCKPTQVDLDLWENYALDWYSGRCVYTKEIVVPDKYLTKNTKLVLDLGKVKHFAEIWINDKLVDTRIWPPYQTRIQDYLKPGKNKITVIVANLIANEMKWNIFDQSQANFRARWVHDLHLAREPQRLNSGLLGPVKIVPFKKVDLEIPISN